MKGIERQRADRRQRTIKRNLKEREREREMKEGEEEEQEKNSKRKWAKRG